MDPTGDYTVHFADPDMHVSALLPFFQWHDILQVIIPRSSALASATSGERSSQEEGATTCPICLSPPTAPRMTKCGHVFCFPCILHYLSMSDNKWARCPICFDSVNERQLKCVKWFEGPAHVDEGFEGTSTEASSSSSIIEDAAPRAGSQLRMRLIQRPQITTLALPRSHTWPSDLLPPHQAPFHFLPDVFSYAKFMLATPNYLITDLTKDLDDLAAERRMLSGMNDELGVSFIHGAENKVRQQIAKAVALETPVLKEQVEKAHRDQPENNAPAIPSEEVPTEFVAFKSRSGINTPVQAPSSPMQAKESSDTNLKLAQQNRNGPRQRRNLNPPPPTTSTYYYYQAASGLPLFLHPLDIKILLSHFSSYALFPDDITVRVEALSEGTVNDDLRKRCKYLAHMPKADLEGVVGKDGLKNFEGALKMRTSRRKEKGRKDDRARARAEEKEREREKGAVEWRSSATMSTAHYDFPSEELASTSDDHESAAQAQPQPEMSGAWGARSFASALHSPPSHRSHPSRGGRQQDAEDEWDIDVAWHEMEHRELVVLGSGGGGARRR
ncbi:hypothetical protein BDQ17DRAFT_1345414 [Cyathus striatus]|nr:hypothetical protein BDQ17DRAFT_1345414 [Cyathus striatus]